MVGKKNMKTTYSKDKLKFNFFLTLRRKRPFGSSPKPPKESVGEIA